MKPGRPEGFGLSLKHFKEINMRAVRVERFEKILNVASGDVEADDD